MHFNKYTLIFILIFLLCGFFKNICIILFIVITHELAHVIVAKLLGYKIISIEIYPFGGITKIDKKLNDYIICDLLIASAGIILQFFYFCLGQMGIITSSLFNDYNIAIMVFNLLPIIPLDGSKIVFELANYFMPYKMSLSFYTVISFISIIIYTICNLKYNLNNYFLITLFIYKTWQIYKDQKIIYYKFILERKLYNFHYRKIKNQNIPISKYQKDIKYYYHINGKIIDEKNII